MTARRTLEFLPSIFQTDTNKKFLSATLDQLVSEPEYARLNGYIGRTFAPTYKNSDNYISEIDPVRQNYQLEPSLVIKDASGNVEFYANYPDVINKISYYGGITDNHNRLFENEFYAYNNLIDQDKFINFNQYYWLPNGPRPVLISSDNVVSGGRFTMLQDFDDSCYRVNDLTGENPEIVLARGGTYRFEINQPGSGLWIQTEPGTTGFKRAVPNLSSRDVYGVTNNGEDQGVIEFRVPLVETQDVYLKMPMQTPVDFAIETPFSDIDGRVWKDIIENHRGFDGIDILPDSKTLIFTNISDDPSKWTRIDGSIVPPELRRGVWRVRLTKNGVGEDVINLDYLRNVNINNRIYSRLGLDNANKEFYKNNLNQFITVPSLTAQLDILYYQDESNPNFYGRIRLVNGPTDNIYVDTAILGKKNYTSPSGINFTNGLVVTFDNNVEPAKYAGGTYIVEGVGRGIRLINFDWLKFPESGLTIESVPVDTENWDIDNYDEPYKGPATPQYITMNRGTLDLNAWARHNRWFHVDVLLKSAEINGTTAAFNQAIRATRPIIEFEPDIQLINNGRIGKRPVDYIDTKVLDAFNQVQHSDSLTINGVTLEEGRRILFPNDKDPLVRTQVYKIQWKIQNEPSYSSLYDGTGSGTITIESPRLFYHSTFIPELVDGGSAGPNFYDYSWKVRGRRNLLTAIELRGLDFPNRRTISVGKVEDLGFGEFNIFFTTNFQIDDFIQNEIEIIGSGGTANVFGQDTNFKTDLEIGSAIYTEDGVYLGTIDGIQNDTTASLEVPSTLAVSAETFLYRDPRIQLLISEDSEDELEPYDTIVATSGDNKGNTFWFDGTDWHIAQLKNKSTQYPLFDVFDNNRVSFSTYLSSQFSGTKIFSYKPGNGAPDKTLGFPLSFSPTSSVADIVFNNDFGIDKFKYQLAGKFVEKKVDSGFLRQNTGRYNFIKRNNWTTVNRPSRQYQIISDDYTGKTNHFEIDVLPVNDVDTPTIKVFVNSKILTSTNYRVSKVGIRDTVEISTNVLQVGDRVDILIFSDEISNLGFYQVPTNLDFNSKNEQINNLTLGQLRTNLITTSQNIVDIKGNVPGISNLRDVETKNYNGNILQSSAPVIYAGLFLVHNQANFLNSIEYARKEYTKFKNKFLELAMSLPGLNPEDPKRGVDQILSNINLVKNKNFSWYYSDMVPYGKSDSIKYRVLDVNQRQYKINSKFDDLVLQSRAVLVYHNNQQLIKNRDFYFDNERPAIQLFDHVETAINDVIEIIDYSSTDGNYIPETPTKLGLYPKFLPEIFTDTTYREPLEVIQGHDGSLTPVFGDHRDYYLLELERRIYNNIKIDINKSVDVRSFIPGRFRTSDYDLEEFNRIINSNFMKWVGFNKLDYISNDFFQGNDQFSYNYRQSRDVLFNENLPGYWRGIYQYYYDTDRPHSHPWEMLGFTEKPIWWDDEYGPAPYTSDNLPLWEDLAEGIIKKGNRAGSHLQYARPGLLKIIPVDSNGNLVPPLTRIATKFNGSTVSESWEIGDLGPVESAWRRTSEYPFAVQSAVAVMKPGFYFGTLTNLDKYYKDIEINQYLNSTTGQKITPRQIDINGENINGEITRSSGYINWIVDYLVSLGIKGYSRLRFLLDNLEVQLSYKVSGYTDKKFLTVLAEQYSPGSTNEGIIIPNESYTVHLNKSVPVERAFYSAVIVEKTSSGFAVSGYNLNNPYFTIIPSEPSGERFPVEVENFQAVIYTRYRKQKLSIPYGTEFKTRQQVVDFLVSYQRYLFSQGFIFDEYNEDLAQNQDWILSVKEFITWTLQGWSEGNSIVLSPVNSVLKLSTENSVVDQITNDTVGGKILDLNFESIKTMDLNFLREENLFKITSITNKTIGFAELNLVQFEHVLIFDNTTIFNDNLYRPVSGSRQYRLKLVGTKTDNWNGNLSARGFVYNSDKIDSWIPGKDYKKGDVVEHKNQYYAATKNIVASLTFDIGEWRQINKNEIKTGLLPNFATNASRFNDIYDPDTDLLDNQFTRMSNGLIGFRNRNYLSNLNVNTTSQTKFYQGYIKEKGTNRSITSLLGATFNDLINDIDYFEEWALRVGEYGATDINRTVEIELDETASKNNPVGLTIIDDSDPAVDGIINVRNRDLWNRPFNNDSIKFINRPQGARFENDIQFAGYVNTDDVDATVFDGTDYRPLIGSLGDIRSGYIIWVAKDVNKDWNIYRATETEIKIDSISYGLDQTGLISVDGFHDLIPGQTIIVKNFNEDFDGFYKVEAVIDLRTFTVQITEEQSDLLRTKNVVGAGAVFTLSSVRFSSPSQISRFTPRHGWKDGDRVWVDRIENNNWAVYEKNSVWNQNSNLDIRLGSYRSDLVYGTSVKINKTGNFAVVGAPGDQNGIGRIHVFDKITNEEKGALRTGIEGVAGLGKSIDIAGPYIVGGAPDSFNTQGSVLVYKHANETFFTPVQLIKNPDTVFSSDFGASISLSDDTQWLYIGSPGTNKVHYYRLKEFETRVSSYTVEEARKGCRLPYSVLDSDSLAVYIRGDLLVPGVDYNLDPIKNQVNILLENFPSVTSETGVLFELEDSSAVIQGEFGFGPPGTVTIIQRSYYEFKGSIVGGSGIDQFGYSIKTSSDGSILVVGAPGADATSILEVGKATIYSNNRAQDPQIVLQQRLSPKAPVYRARFGTSVDICTTNCSVYIGSPGYSDLDYVGGQVHRFVNTGKLFGNYLGSIANPTVTPGDTININGVNVVFSGSTVESVINDINNAKIVGIQASNVDNKLYLTSNIEVELDKINLFQISGTPLNFLGIQVFEESQLIRKPVDKQGENFGEFLKISPDAETLVVSSTRGTAQSQTIIDGKTTSFDSGATVYIDTSRGTGAVYFYDFLSNSLDDTNDKFGTFIFVEELNAPNLRLGDQFGCSVDLSQNTLYIGASYNDTNAHNAGAVYAYSNPTGRKGWSRVREQATSVDIAGINSISIYDKNSRSKLVSLDYIDPIKGKNLGIVEESLNYKTSKDPAVYNSGTDIRNSDLIDFHWGAQQLGQTWWNLDTVRFIDYEQDSLVYRLNNWGKLFPGSDVAVYEWVESSVLPSEWQSSGRPGIPLRDDDSAYVQINYADAGTGIINIKYYFWVRGITTVSNPDSRKMSVKAIENAIINPKSQNISYAGVIGDSTIALFNCDRFIKKTNVILKVDYDHLPNSNLIHSEFELVAENDSNSIIPTRIVNKLFDSISGIDSNNQRVPDPKLKPSQSLGLEIRPRQTLIVNRFSALKNLVQFVNQVFSNVVAANKLQNSRQYDNAFFFAAEPIPDNFTHRVSTIEERSYVDVSVGDLVLVDSDESFFGLWTLYEVLSNKTFKLVKNQTYKTTDLWRYQNWYASDFDSETVPDYVLDYARDLEKLSPVAGDIIQINNTSTGGFELYRYQSNNVSELVGISNGTIELNDTIWDIEQNGVGFDNQGIDELPFDRDYSKEIRNLLLGLEKEIFVENLQENYNKLLFTIIHYVLSEQKNVDWIFKTSFISVLHKIKELKQYPNFIKDNHTYYEDYINEVKPYRTKLRDYRIGYTGIDPANTNVTDFDLPGYWDNSLKRFRSPSAEIPNIDSILFAQPQYRDWANNFTSEVELITIANPGRGYTQPPQIQIIANGDAGTGAVAAAVINEVTGELIQIYIINSGRGYRNTPFVIINGDGTGAQAYARLSNKKIRSIKTVLKFDRISYQSSVVEWQPNVSYSQGQLVSYQGKGYVARIASQSENFSVRNFDLVSDDSYTNANDRVAATYLPGKNQIPRDVKDDGTINLDRLIPGISYESNTVTNNLEVFNETDLSSPLMDNIVVGTSTEDINIIGGSFFDPFKSYAPEELIPGITFDSLSIKVQTDIEDQQAIFRIFKDSKGKIQYLVVKPNSASLAQDFSYGDDKIYLNNPDSITAPNIGKRKPGIIYINGERIKFWKIDYNTGIITNFVRGTDVTGVSSIHLMNSLVEDQGENSVIPQTTQVKVDRYDFSTRDPVFRPEFTIQSLNVDRAKNNLEVFLGATLLNYGKDYEFTITNVSGLGKLTITFTNVSGYSDGLRFIARYTEDSIWLNQGLQTITDGTGLAGADTVPANFVKSFAHNLP